MGRNTDNEQDAAAEISALRSELEQQMAVNQLLRNELGIHKAAADHWRQAVNWVYQRSREALMMPHNRPRAARQAREQALCDINYRLGGMIR